LRHSLNYCAVAGRFAQVARHAGSGRMALRAGPGRRRCYRPVEGATRTDHAIRHAPNRENPS